MYVKFPVKTKCIFQLLFLPEKFILCVPHRLQVTVHNRIYYLKYVAVLIEVFVVGSSQILRWKIWWFNFDVHQSRDFEIKDLLFSDEDWIYLRVWNDLNKVMDPDEDESVQEASKQMSQLELQGECDQHC